MRCAAFAAELDARDDLHATADYRRMLVRELGRADHRGGATMPRLSADARHTVRLEINGRAVEGEAEPRMLLTDFLRHKLGLTGTHVGCEHGVCGACTIQIDGAPARACLTLAVQADGASIRTVEGLAPEPGRLSVLQEAFRRHHALQCGFCTAGILMSLDWYLRAHARSERSRRCANSSAGHICRCTGYVPIVAAALDAAKRLREAGETK